MRLVSTLLFVLLTAGFATLPATASGTDAVPAGQIVQLAAGASVLPPTAVIVVAPVDRVIPPAPAAAAGLSGGRAAEPEPGLLMHWSTFAALGLGLVGLVWVRRHTAALSL